MSTWFTTGTNAIEEEKKRLEKSRITPYRFWLYPGDDNAKRVIFLDDWSRTRKRKLPNGDVIEDSIVPFSYYEHQIELDGDWRNYMTCLKGMDTCPLCENKYSRYFISMYTILVWVPSKETADDGYWSKQLYATRIKTSGLLSSTIRRNPICEGNFKFVECDIVRTDKDAPNSGNYFNPISKKTIEHIQAIIAGSEKINDINPFDYEKMFKPFDSKEIYSMLDNGRIGKTRYDAMRAKTNTNVRPLNEPTSKGDEDIDEPPF